ncbi:MAG: Do family serine endopeptidase [Bacteroidales bacterium]|nr:Do family serine endopeptidase [Bacteroidales bacterium]
MKLKKIIGTFLIALTGGIVAFFLFSVFVTENNKQVLIQEKLPVTFTGNSSQATSISVDFTEAARKSINAVVHVKTSYKQTVSDSYSLYDFFFGNRNYQQREVPIAFGSGVIITKDGYIVTNNHVIKNSDNIEVVLNDRRSYLAKIVGTDPTTDIALLKIDEKDLPYISYANSDDLQVGEWVLAVGNPFNLTSTVTAGIVSAKARNINILKNKLAIESFIQTDAAVNAGNSGGALVNIEGELIGINTAIATGTGYYYGYSFAIPSNIVKKVVSDIIEFGEVQRAILGVTIMDINAKLAEELNIDKIEGVLVNNVLNNGAADNAGIEKGDLIIKIGKNNINTVSELLEQIGKFRPGDKVDITIKKNHKYKTVLVTLQNLEGNTNILKSEELIILGAKFEKLSNDDLKRLRISNGLKIIELSSGKFKSAGIKEGFIIIHVNRERVENIQELKNVINNIEGGIYIEGIYPNGMAAYYAFGM